MRIQESITIASSASQAWAILGEQFGDIGQWATPIQFSTLEGNPQVGAIRHCHIAAFGPVPAGIIKERLLEYNPKEMYLIYDAIEGMPKFIAKAQNHWSVKALNEQNCQVTTKSTLKIHGWMRAFEFLLAKRFRKGGVAVLEELKYRIEKDIPHPRKVHSIPLKTAISK
jgi:hypothetical protein